MKTNRDGQRIIDRYGTKTQISIEIAEKVVEHFVITPLNPNQFSALVSFAQCRGATAFARSILVKHVNQGQMFLAAKQFRLWVNQGGKRRVSLAKRRAAEEKLFLKPFLVVKNDGNVHISIP